MSDRVCAVVVTYNRKALLRECLTALQAQTRPVDAVLVVDNASTDGTLAMLKEEFPGCQTLPLPANVGGAGGFHDGMKQAYEHGFDWVWLMDDDGRAAPDCLEKLLAQSRPDSVLVPLQQNHLGYRYGVCVWNGTAVEVTGEVIAHKRPLTGDYLFSFVGPLLSKEVIKNAGLPNKDYFIYFDDWEYALRLRQKTNAEIIVVPEAIFFHDIGDKHHRHARFLWRKSVRVTPAPWKLYYGARNPIFMLTRGKRPPRELLRYLLFQLRWMAGDMVFEPDRWQRVSMRLRGIRDGAMGRLGKRV